MGQVVLQKLRNSAQQLQCSRSLTGDSKIGFGIHQASEKLSKLAKLAKRTSAFDDPTMEIQELMAVIKQDITALYSAVVDLQLPINSRNDSGHIFSDTKQEPQQQQQQLVPLQDSYMRSRAEALQNAESTIHELSSIFNQLVTLVSQQGDLLSESMRIWMTRRQMWKELKGPCSSTSTACHLTGDGQDILCIGFFPSWCSYFLWLNSLRKLGYKTRK